MPVPDAKKSKEARAGGNSKVTFAQEEFEFQLLLGELNSQFRCLTQRIADLTRENQDLRLQAASAFLAKSAPAAHGGQHKSEGRALFEDATTYESSDVRPHAAAEDDSREFFQDEAKRSQLEDFRFMQREASGGNKTKKNKAKSQQERPSSEPKANTKQVQLQTVSSEPVEEALEIPSKKMRSSKWKSSQVNMQELQLNNIISWDGGSQVRRSQISSKITSTINHIRMFDYLDSGHKGKLTVNDLMKIMERASESATYDGLASVIQQLTGDMDAANIGLDIRGFQHLMNDDSEEDDDSCKAALRRACRASKSRVRRSTLKRPSEPHRKDDGDKTRFEKYAPVILESVPPMVILLNALVAGLSVDNPQHEDLWDIAEYLFVALYSLEFLAKMRLQGCHGFWRGKERWWNIFDFICLSVSLADLAIKIAVSIFLPGDSDSGGTLFMMIKILRLSRLARLVRTLRFHVFTELKMMVLGVVSGMRVLTWAIVLLCMLIYLVGVGTTNLLGKSEPEFRDMRSSMFTLFRCWTDGCDAYDGTPLAERLRAEYGFVWMSFHILITMFVTVGIFNLIMAIFIDNVVTSQLTRKHCEMVERTPEIMARFKHLFAGFIKDGTGTGVDARATMGGVGLWGALRSVIGEKGKGQLDMKEVDKEWEILRRMNMSITKDVFQDWLEDEDFQTLLDEADIDVAGRSELFDVLDVDMGGELSMDELTIGLMNMRGAVTKSDIVAIRLKTRYLTSILESRMEVS